MKQKIFIIFSLSLFFFYACKKESEADPVGDPRINIKTILTGYEIIWGMDFLPNGDLLFGEKRGKLYRKTNDAVIEITGLPSVLAFDQGGLLDIRVHPQYSINGWVYACYSASVPQAGGQLRLIRFKIFDNQVGNIENIFSTDGSNTWNGHFGSRIVFDKEGYLFLSVGEGGTGSYGGPNTINLNAQDPKSGWGKIHRMMDDGSIPVSNPVITGNTEPATIYTYGHRNPQGLVMHPETGEIWEAEHGPKGGDEINIISKGGNYGWPLYSLGVNYDGSAISSGHTSAGIRGPLYSWTPSIGTCGIAFITSEKFKSWKGNLLVGGLASQKLHRCILNGNTITKEEILLTGSGRVRNVIQAPDGSIYVSVENPGRIIQIIPE